MGYFPMFVELSGKPVLVIGGGKVAERRVRTLLEFGAAVTVVSPEIGDGLASLYKEGKISVIFEEYKRQHLQRGESGESVAPGQAKDRLYFVLAAAPEAVNEAVVRDCRALGIPVNNAARKEQCDFYFPGIAKAGETVAGITAGGLDHKRAAALTEKIRRLLAAEEG